MHATEKIKDTTSNHSVIAFLVEQYGEKVGELLEKIESSVVKLDLKNEKDAIAKEIEEMHHHPIQSNYKMASMSKAYLSALIHEKMIKEIFHERKNEFDFLFITKSNLNMYLLKLKDNSFEKRDSFRNDIQEKFYTKPYSDLLDVTLDFLPNDVEKNDVISDNVIEIKQYFNE